MKIFSILITVPLLLFSCARITHEKESNDSFRSANPLHTEATVKGRIDYEGDRDFFYLENRGSLSSNQPLKINLSALSNIDLILDVYRNNRLIIQINDHGPGTNEVFAGLTASEGLVFSVRASDPEAENPEQHYTLQIRALRLRRSSESEPNNTPALATPISTGGTILGFYSPARDPMNMNQEEDWFVLESGQDNLILRIDVTGVPDTDSVLALYDSSRLLIKESDDGRLGEGETLINTGLPYKGLYYIRLYTRGGANPEVPYRLITDLSKHEPSLEREENDSPYSASSLEIGEPVQGWINPSSDSDHFRINLMGKGDYTMEVTVTAIDRIDLKLEVLDSSGRVREKADLNPAGLPEHIPNLGIHSSPVFIRVSSKSNGNTEQSYRLTTRIIPRPADLESESGNKFFPTPVEAGSRMTGFISRSNDQDYYLFRCPEKGLYTVRFIQSAASTELFIDFAESTRNGDKQNIIFRQSAKNEWTGDLGRGFYLLTVQGTSFDVRNPYGFLIEKKQ